MANSQVEAAFDVVKRAEKVKYISEFADSAYKMCSEITPREIQNWIKRNLQSRPADGRVTKIIIELREPIQSIEKSLGRKVKISENRLSNAEGVLAGKARALAIWLPEGKEKRSIEQFASNISWSTEEGSITWDDDIETALKRRGYCETAVSGKLAELTKY